MDNWRPATKEEVQAAVQRTADHAGRAVWAHYSPYLNDPYPASIDRFGEIVEAFVVARASARIVYFNDVEDTFGTATEFDGRLLDCAEYDDLRVAINEALRESGQDPVSDPKRSPDG